MSQQIQTKDLVYSDPQSDVLESTADRILFHAGIGSGKSQVIGVISAEFVLNNPEAIGFIGANTYQQLTKSTLARVFTVWQEQFGLMRDVHYVVDHIPPQGYKEFGTPLKTYENVISFQNGAKIYVASLDNYKVIDGTELGWACLDETKDTKEEAVKEVIIARLRQKAMLIHENGLIFKYANLQSKLDSGEWKECEDPEKVGYYVDKNGKLIGGYNPLYIFTSPAKTKWLSDWFNLDEEAEEISKQIFSKEDYYRKRTGRQLVIIASTYHNQKNLPPGYIQGIIDDLAGNEGLIDMLIYGSPFGKSGGEFITTYSRLQHVKEFAPWPELPVHATFDFNIVPYISCTLWQMKYNDEKKRWLVRCFDEFCLSNPKNNSESLCEEIITYYEPLLKNGFFYYGDWNGNTENTATKALRSNYQVIESMMQRYISNASKRVITNQGVEKRRRFMNKLFKGAFPLDIEINIKCKELRADLEFCKEGPDGGKLKQLVEKDGRKFQDRGHNLDNAEYFFTSAFDNFFHQ